jgi:hypothetical protein
MLQAGSSPVRVPDEVDLFNLPNPSSRSMALGSTRPLTEMSTRNLSGGKSGRRLELTSLPQSVSRMSENVGSSTSRNSIGLHGMYRDTFTFTFTSKFCRSYYIPHISCLNDFISVMIPSCYSEQWSQEVSVVLPQCVIHLLYQAHSIHCRTVVWVY